MVHKNLSNEDSASLNSQEKCEDRQVSSLPYSRLAKSEM